MACLSCQCGKVKGHLEGEFGPHMHCWCDGCRQFTAWMAKERKNDAVQLRTPEGAIVGFQVFKNQIKVSEGNELIKGVKLNHGTTTVRFIASCCNTPMFATKETPKIVPIAGLFSPFLVETITREPEFLLFGPEAAKRTEDGQYVRNGLAYKFLARSTFRAMQGTFLRKYTPFEFLRTGQPYLIVSDQIATNQLEVDSQSQTNPQLGVCSSSERSKEAISKA